MKRSCWRRKFIRSWNSRGWNFTLKGAFLDSFIEGYKIARNRGGKAKTRNNAQKLQKGQDAPFLLKKINILNLRPASS